MSTENCFRTFNFAKKSNPLLSTLSQKMIERLLLLKWKLGSLLSLSSTVSIKLKCSHRGNLVAMHVQLYDF